MPLETPEPLRRVETRETPQGRQASQEMRRSVSRRSESRHAGDGETYAREEPMENDDEDAESDGAEGDSLAEDEFSRQQMIYAAQQRNMGLLSQVMDEDQLERHMASRRGTLNKASVRKLINHVLSQSVNQHFVMAASGVGKVFVGEMVEQGTCFLICSRSSQSPGGAKRDGGDQACPPLRGVPPLQAHTRAPGALPAGHLERRRGTRTSPPHVLDTLYTHYGAPKELTKKSRTRFCSRPPTPSICSAVMPSALGRLRSQPPSPIRIAAVCEWPDSTARCSGVFPRRSAGLRQFHHVLDTRLGGRRPVAARGGVEQRTNHGIVAGTRRTVAGLARRRT